MTMHTAPRRLALAAALVVVLALVPAAFAGKGGKPGNGTSGDSVTLAMLDARAAEPHWGDQVTFVVSSTTTTRPFVGLNCSQGGTLVYSLSRGFYADSTSTGYTLSSSYWTGGAADCTATLYYFSSNGKEVVLATTSFAVDA
jgi:hypothetical protein